MEDITLETIEWTAPEYKHKEHDNDWFWTIGVITVVACGIALWSSSYIFAIFLLISGICLSIFSFRHPETLEYKIETKGFSSGTTSFTWKEIKSFNIKKLEDEEFDKLLLETKKHFLPIHSYYIPKENHAQIKAEIKKIITQSEIEESRTTEFAEKLGF